MLKFTAHNLIEVKALIREAYSNGNEQEFHNRAWFTHDNEYFAKSFVRDTEFELVVEDVDSLDGYRSVIVEV